MFVLHERLAADSVPVTELPLSTVLLMNNRLFPWLVLVPRREHAREIIDLPPAEQHMLMDEIAFASRILQQHCQPHKLNVASLGNQVPMLHVHIIARFREDHAWPHPVWGTGGEPYPNLPEISNRFSALFKYEY